MWTKTVYYVQSNEVVEQSVHSSRQFTFASCIHRLLARSNELALRAGIGLPAASQGSSAILRSELLHPCLQLRPEVADKTLDRPCESLAKSCKIISDHLDYRVKGWNLPQIV